MYQELKSASHVTLVRQLLVKYPQVFDQRCAVLRRRMVVKLSEDGVCWSN